MHTKHAVRVDEDSAGYHHQSKQKSAFLLVLLVVSCGIIANPNRMFCVLNGRQKCHLRRVGGQGLLALPGAESVDFGERHWREVDPF